MLALTELLAGYKTYIGLAITLIGVVATKAGWSVDATGLANDIATFGGLAIAVVGRFVAKPKA
jgi:hypothetical protein